MFITPTPPTNKAIPVIAETKVVIAPIIVVKISICSEESWSLYYPARFTWFFFKVSITLSKTVSLSNLGSTYTFIDEI